MPEFIGSRPFLAIIGQIRNDVSEDIISASFDDGINSLRVILSNWDANALAYKYSDGPLLRIGTRVELYIGLDAANLRRMFDGKISGIAPCFSSDKSSTISIEAVGLPEKTNTLIEARLGNELREFKPMLSSAKTAIECSGTVEGNPDLRKNSTMSIVGTGQAFDRPYFVVKTIHSFDLQFGYRTHFVATTGKALRFSAASEDSD